MKSNYIQNKAQAANDASSGLKERLYHGMIPDMLWLALSSFDLLEKVDDRQTD